MKNCPICEILGTAPPIVAPRALAEREVRTVLLMSPNYREENQRLLEEAKIDADLLDWN